MVVLISKNDLPVLTATSVKMGGRKMGWCWQSSCLLSRCELLSCNHQVTHKSYNNMLVFHQMIFLDANILLFPKLFISGVCTYPSSIFQFGISYGDWNLYLFFWSLLLQEFSPKNQPLIEEINRIRWILLIQRLMNIFLLLLDEVFPQNFDRFEFRPILIFKSKNLSRVRSAIHSFSF